MNLKTFQAESMSQALAAVKRELGPDAVILNTRTFQRRGLLGLFNRTVVEITASSEVKIAPRPRRSPAPPKPVAEPTQTFGSVLKKTYGGAAGEFKPVIVPPTKAGMDAVAAAVEAATRPAVNDPALTQEIKQIRSMVERMMRTASRQPKIDMPDKLFNQYLALLEQEVTEELAEEVVTKVRASLKPDQLNDEKLVRDAISREIARLIPTDKATNNRPRPADGRPRTIALVGPTGVGKTTTLAKLAATFRLRDRKKVALVTIDTYRIAAVEQLRTYAGIINLPLHVVTSPTELTATLEKCRGYDVVLIDTAGRSPKDDEKLEQLAAFLQAANPHETHLVLSSTCSEEASIQAAERFSRLRIDHIIFTKLDEAVSFGVLLNVVRRVNKQLSYITTGQEVPHQIEPGRSERLAGLILGEGV